MNVQDRISKFQGVKSTEESQTHCISGVSDKKKYNFVSGLENDVKSTRKLLIEASEENNSCTFGQIFNLADNSGGVANLTRALQNLKKAKEIHFEPEVMFQGENDDEIIHILPEFKEGKYQVTDDNCFRKPIADSAVPEELRHGRSYFQENKATENVKTCFTCNNQVNEQDRFVFRGHVYHVQCVTCSNCSAPIRDKIANVSFDGKVMCSAACIKSYDGQNQKQNRM